VPSSARASPTGWARSSPARLVARGYDHRRIARELFLAAKTVRNHVSAILAKLGRPTAPRRSSAPAGRGSAG
jgi:FixJ family two-component response regulator